MNNRILTGDCLDVLATLPAGSVDLVATDPPFNIGLKYPGYDDCRTPEEYLGWLEERFKAVHRVLSPTGTLFVAIGQHMQAEVYTLGEIVGGTEWQNARPLSPRKTADTREFRE
jgi:DNA modification methylase